MPDPVAAKNAAKAKPDKIKPVVKPDSVFTKFSRFFRESYIEVFKKASWPTWLELRKFTTVVIIAVLIVGFWIGGLDYLLGVVTKHFGYGLTGSGR